MSFSVDLDLGSGDFIEFSFDTNNLLYSMFEKDLEGNATNEYYRYLDCREYGSSGNISASRITCILYFGDPTADPPKPAKLSIKTTRGYDGYPSPNTMRLLIANVKNPSTVGMNVGV